MKILVKSLSLIMGVLITAYSPSQVRNYWPTESWQIKSLSSVGIDSLKIDEMHQTIVSSMSYVDAFLIVKDGYLVYEMYYGDGYDENSQHQVASVTKSITSILIGILKRQGMLDSIDTKPVIEYFPEYKDVNTDPRINNMTIKHLMSFTTGLDVDDFSWTSPNMLERYFGLPFVSDPGTYFNYDTPASHTLAAIINKITGTNAHTFANNNLLNRIGSVQINWSTFDGEYNTGGCCSYWKPRDMLRIGYLYLNRGIWDGDTIVDPSWVDSCTIAHSNGGSPHNAKYGYNWWITENNGYHAYFAGGYGGQFIYVVLDLDLVVAITCDLARHRENARFLINSHVVPAIQGATNIPTYREYPDRLIYPNPASDMISINSHDLEIKEIHLLSSSGTYMTIFENSTEISLDDIPEGVYIASIVLTNGNVIREKIIVTSK